MPNFFAQMAGFSGYFPAWFNAILVLLAVLLGLYMAWMASTKKDVKKFTDTPAIAVYLLVLALNAVSLPLDALGTIGLGAFGNLVGMGLSLVTTIFLYAFLIAAAISLFVVYIPDVVNEIRKMF